MAGGPSTPELAAAVNDAGGFGFVAAGYLTPEALRSTLDRTRALTPLPIGVNVFVPSPVEPDSAAIAQYVRGLEPEAERLGVRLGEPRWEDDEYAAKLDLLARASVHTVSFTFGCPEPDVVRRLHAAGSSVAVTATTVTEALAAAEVGADALVVQGTEAGGHQGGIPRPEPNETPLLDALAALRQAGLPMIATGGLATSTHVTTALAAGATAVQVGTALLCTPEAATSAVHRDAILERRYPDTLLTRAFSGRWARGLANRFAMEHPDAPGGYPQIHHVTRPLRSAATRVGDPDVPNLWAGTEWRSTRAEPAAAVIARLAAEL
jgi:nitronate monooxygenase